jgi:type I restriction enzyme S subunit
MSQLPNSWHSVPLLDVSELIRGVTYSKTDVGTAEEDDYVGVMRANNIQDRQFDLSDLVYVPRRLVADGQYVREGDVVVTTSSGSISVVGKAAQATREMNLGFGAFCGVLRPSSLLCKRFFGHYFSSESYRNYVASVARGVNINNLKRSHFEELNIPLAPLSRAEAHSGQVG